MCSPRTPFDLNLIQFDNLAIATTKYLINATAKRARGVCGANTANMPRSPFAFIVLLVVHPSM